MDQTPEDLGSIGRALLQPLSDQRLVLDEQGAGPACVAPPLPRLGVRLAVLPQHLQVAQEAAEGPLFLAEQLRVDRSAAGLWLLALDSGGKAGQRGLTTLHRPQQDHWVAALLKFLQRLLLSGSEVLQRQQSLLRCARWLVQASELGPLAQRLFELERGLE